MSCYCACVHLVWEIQYKGIQHLVEWESMDFRPERTQYESEILQGEGKKKARSGYDDVQVQASVEIDLVAVVGVAGCISVEVAIEEVAACSY